MNTSSTDVPGAVTPLRLTVVVVAFTGGPVLEHCLAALHTQAGAGPIETIVVFDAAGPCAPAAARARTRFSTMRWVAAPPGTTVPQMRCLGITNSSGHIVALLEGDCAVEPGWTVAAVAAHETADVAIGGAVEPGPYAKALDWAVYFCEYGRFMLPLVPRANLALALASNNVTYKRGPLMAEAADPRGFYDVAVHSRWQDAGLPMRTDAAMVVRNLNSWSLPHVTSVPYHHGRTFAAQRFPGQAGRRALYGLLALSLPVLKAGRVIADTVAKRRLMGRLVQALPWIVVFVTSWSLGEMVGYLRGPGDSASRWR